MHIRKCTILDKDDGRVNHNVIIYNFKIRRLHLLYYVFATTASLTNYKKKYSCLVVSFVYN